MKIFYSALLAILISFNVFAELSPRDQKLTDMALSGDLKQLKIAAQGIYQNKISEPLLIDILAEILLKKYPAPHPSEIDTIAWVTRAIGGSENGRYHAVLSEVKDSAGDRKLVKYAKKALKELGDAKGEQYVTGMYQLPENLYVKESDSVRDDLILSLLTDGSLKSLKQGAQSIMSIRAQTQTLTDTAAEILITYHANASDHQIETFSWVAKAIGQSTSGRYADVLTEVKENGAHRKLRKHARAALERHGPARGEQYKKGMLGKPLPTYDF